jgi:SAM-dependent methyltransferase
MSLYDRVLGHPFVFNRIRPLFVGGIDWTSLYEELAADDDSLVLDVGCGTGVAQQYLRGFRRYWGFDTDRNAINVARRNTKKPNVEYHCGFLQAEQLRCMQPTRVLLSGLLHHLSDSEAVTLLRMCGDTPSVERIATADTVYISGQHLSNLLAFFDRGRFVRYTEAFLSLAEKANLQVLRHQIVRSHPESGRALYLIMTLSPRRA